MIAIAQVNPIANILDELAASLEPRVRVPASDWACENLVLPPETSAEGGGQWTLDGRLFFREPLDAIDDPNVETITIMGVPQLGKTEVLKAMLLSRADLDPAPTMLVTPDQNKTLEMRDEIYATAEHSPIFAGKIPSARQRNARWIDLGTCVCYLAWSGGLQTVRGRTAKCVLVTEVDVFQDSPLAGKTARNIRARTKAWWDPTVVYESSPTDADSEIASLYEAGDQRTWQVPCPHCGHRQELRFYPHSRGKFAGRGGVVGVKDKTGAFVDPEDARRLAYYVCERGCKINNEEKNDMVAAGCWVPIGQHVTKAGRIIGKPERSGRHRSYHIHGLMSEKTSFGSMTATYLEHKRDGRLREFFNNELGLAHRGSTKVATWQQLAKRLVYTHVRGTVPAEADFLTAAADIQGGEDKRVYYVVRGWGDRCTSWLVDWGVLRPRVRDDGAEAIASDIVQLNQAVLQRAYKVVGGENARGQESMTVRVLGLDCNYRMTDVHGFVNSHGDTDRVRALRGDHRVLPSQRYRMTLVERNARTGKPYEGGLELWGVYVNIYREDVIGRFSAPTDEPGAWFLPADILPDGKDYLQQITNKVRTETFRGGQRRVDWVERNKQLGDHYCDCEILARALADMVVGDLGWDASAWPWRRQRAVKRAARSAQGSALMPQSGDFSARP